MSSCIVQTDTDVFDNCAPTDIMFFKPIMWGNEQFPIHVSALYCDTNHQIIFNNSGVLCTFTDARLSDADKQKMKFKTLAQKEISMKSS